MVEDKIDQMQDLGIENNYYPSPARDTRTIWFRIPLPAWLLQIPFFFVRRPLVMSQPQIVLPLRIYLPVVSTPLWCIENLC